MLLRGAEALRVSLDRSYMVGDMISDVLAGANAGCRASLLLTSGSTPTETERRQLVAFPQVADLQAACDWILSDAPRRTGAAHNDS